MIKLGRSEAPMADQITASDQSSCTSHNPLAFQLDRPRARHMEFVLKIQLCVKILNIGLLAWPEIEITREQQRKNTS